METYLAHHGILGMKWGIRRYQNEDGTLTAVGKRRYIDSQDMYDGESKKAGIKSGKAAAIGASVGVASKYAANRMKDLSAASQRRSDDASFNVKAMDYLLNRNKRDMNINALSENKATFNAAKSRYDESFKMFRDASSNASKYADIARGAATAASIISGIGTVAVIGSAVVSAGQLAYGAYVKYQERKNES